MLPPPGLESLVDDGSLAAVATTPTPGIGVDIPTPTSQATESLSSLATALTTSLTPTAMSTTAPTIFEEPQGECELLGPFAIWVQLLLGGLALLSLVYKRWRERPQRPVKIWFFDVSKQVVGSLLVHAANVFMSMLTSGRFSIKVGPETVSTAAMMMRLVKRDGDDGDDQYTPNPCSFYLLNLAIDTTLGIPILIVLLRITTGLISFTPLGQPPESIQSGNYGSPPNWRWWSKQSLIYFIGLFGMKVCVLIIFVLMPWISRVGDWALGWTEGNERLQIVFVMMLFPLIMNAMQYYIIDSFIKKQDNAGHERLPDEDPEVHVGGARIGAYDDEAFRPSTDSRASEGDTRLHRRSKDDEYDPDLDGDAPTIVGSSSSGRTGKVLTTNLFPKE